MAKQRRGRTVIFWCHEHEEVKEHDIVWVGPAKDFAICPIDGKGTEMWAFKDEAEYAEEMSG